METQQVEEFIERYSNQYPQVPSRFWKILTDLQPKSELYQLHVVWNDGVYQVYGLSKEVSALTWCVLMRENFGDLAAMYQIEKGPPPLEAVCKASKRIIIGGHTYHFPPFDASLRYHEKVPPNKEQQQLQATKALISLYKQLMNGLDRESIREEIAEGGVGAAGGAKDVKYLVRKALGAEDDRVALLAAVIESTENE